MGSVISTIFGGGMESPEIPEVKPLPQREQTEPVAQAARDEERRKLRARNGGVNATLLTSPLGASGQDAKSGPGLLGRAG